MRISVNSEPRDIADHMTVADLLKHLEVRSQFCAVERNEELVPRAKHAECVLQPGDVVEIVTLVGGG